MVQRYVRPCEKWNADDEDASQRRFKKGFKIYDKIDGKEIVVLVSNYLLDIVVFDIEDLI